MRVVLAIVVGLACPLTAAAQPAGDRYGPASVQQRNEAAASAFQGRALSWSNKQTAPSSAAPAPQAPPAPRLPAAPTPYRQASIPAYAPFQPQVPLPLQQRQAAPQAQPAPSLPTSIYGPATPASALAKPAPMVRPSIAAAAPPPAAAPAARAPVRLDQPTAAAPAPQRLASAAPAMGATRLYSVHRGYGMTPDAIPELPAGNRYVLIGPPDGEAPAKTKTDDDAPDARPGAF